MNVVVLVKQVPDTDALIQIDTDGVSIKTNELSWIMNPYDELAVEEALRIKEKHGGSVTILTMGPQRVKGAIQSALAMGADRGIHICDPAVDGSDALATAKILTAALKEIPYDLIIAGQRGVGEDNYQVGAAVAEYLDIPQISFVVAQNISDGKIICTRVVEGGCVVVEAALPVLFSTQRGLNEPRYASLPGIMKAKKKPLVIKTLADLGIDPRTVGTVGRKVNVVSLMFPPKRPDIQMIDGNSAQEKAAHLVKLLSSKAKVL